MHEARGGGAELTGRCSRLGWRARAVSASSGSGGWGSFRSWTGGSENGGDVGMRASGGMLEGAIDSRWPRTTNSWEIHEANTIQPIACFRFPLCCHSPERNLWGSALTSPERCHCDIPLESSTESYGHSKKHQILRLKQLPFPNRLMTLDRDDDENCVAEYDCAYDDDAAAAADDDNDADLLRKGRAWVSSRHRHPAHFLDEILKDCLY